MIDMSKEELRQVVAEAVHETLQGLYVNRQQHYEDHLFLKDLREFAVTCKSTVLKWVLRFVLSIVTALFILGFVAWHGKLK